MNLETRCREIRNIHKFLQMPKKCLEILYGYLQNIRKHLQTDLQGLRNLGDDMELR